jgi:hypothetical protein
VRYLLIWTAALLVVGDVNTAPKGHYERQADRERGLIRRVGSVGHA